MKEHNFVMGKFYVVLTSHNASTSVHFLCAQQRKYFIQNYLQSKHNHLKSISKDMNKFEL